MKCCIIIGVCAATFLSTFAMQEMREQKQLQHKKIQLIKSEADISSMANMLYVEGFLIRRRHAIPIRATSLLSSKDNKNNKNVKAFRSMKNISDKSLNQCEDMQFPSSEIDICTLNKRIDQKWDKPHFDIDTLALVWFKRKMCNE